MSAGLEDGGSPRSDIGPISGYLQDVYNLAPEVVRIDQFEFRLTVASRVVTFQSEAKQVDPEFLFAVRRIKGFGFTADVQGIAATLPHAITVNLADKGRARAGLFEDPIRMSYLISNKDGNSIQEFVWDAFYRFQPGATMAAVWVATVASLEAAVTYEYGISVTGDVLRSRTLPGGALLTDPRGRAR